MPTSRCEKTNYPKIFRECYWGWGGDEIDSYSNDNYSNPAIISNRNNFVETHGIRRIKKLPRALDDVIRIDGFDHVERYYTTNKEHVVITSPYTEHHAAEFEKYGFKPYSKLYGNNAYTYIGIIPQDWRTKLSRIKKDLIIFIKENNNPTSELSLGINTSDRDAPSKKVIMNQFICKRLLIN